MEFEFPTKSILSIVISSWHSLIASWSFIADCFKRIAAWRPHLFTKFYSWITCSRDIEAFCIFGKIKVEFNISDCTMLNASEIEGISTAEILSILKPIPIKCSCWRSCHRYSCAVYLERNIKLCREISGNFNPFPFFKFISTRWMNTYIMTTIFTIKVSRSWGRILIFENCHLH